MILSFSLKAGNVGKQLVAWLDSHTEEWFKKKKTSRKAIGVMAVWYN